MGKLKLARLVAPASVPVASLAEGEPPISGGRCAGNPFPHCSTGVSPVRTSETLVLQREKTDGDLLAPRLLSQPRVQPGAGIVKDAAATAATVKPGPGGFNRNRHNRIADLETNPDRGMTEFRNGRRTHDVRPAVSVIRVLPFVLCFGFRAWSLLFPVPQARAGCLSSLTACRYG